MQRHIRAFGGDPGNVTIMGQSAGATAVLEHVRARYAGESRGEVPFERAVALSPFRVSQWARANATLERVLERFGIGSLRVLKGLEYEALRRINGVIVGAEMPWGSFAFGMSFI